MIGHGKTAIDQATEETMTGIEEIQIEESGEIVEKEMRREIETNVLTIGDTGTVIELEEVEDILLPDHHLDEGTTETKAGDDQGSVLPMMTAGNGNGQTRKM